jgi:hypothetical protein
MDPVQAPTPWPARPRRLSDRACIDERIAELERLKLGLTECIGWWSPISAAARAGHVVNLRSSLYTGLEPAVGFERAV